MENLDRLTQKANTVYTLEDLLAIVETLRSPEGCPWDQKQTHESIRRDLIEEAYEVVEAIDQSDPVALQEELGDVLLQVVFHADLAKDNGHFTFNDVCNGICNKLLRRHPHVFGSETAKNMDDVMKIWEEEKQKETKNLTSAPEKPRTADRLHAVPKALPALIASEKVQSRASRLGVPLPSLEAQAKALKTQCTTLVKEMEEIAKCSHKDKQEPVLHAEEPSLVTSDAASLEQFQQLEELLGELLFSVSNLARFVDVDAEQALKTATERFIQTVSQAEEP